MTEPAILARAEAAGAVVFRRGDWNLNLIGVRALPGTPDRFDDRIHAVWREGGAWRELAVPATTDPGLYWLQNPGRAAGTAILQPGQYRGCWKVGTHSGYPALAQARPEAFRVWRDRDRNGSPDRAGATYADALGINLHHAGESSVQVGRWSAGCQVVARLADWRELWSVISRSAQVYGPVFSYTLLEG